MHRFRESLFALGLSCTLLPMLAVAQSTLHVPSEYSTIAAAVAAASDGDTVEIAAGTYYEHNLTIPQSMTLRGAVADSGAVVIDAQEMGRHFHMYNLASGVVFENLCLINGRISQGGGSMYIRYTPVQLDNCDFINNSGYSYYTESGYEDCTPYSAYGGALRINGSQLTTLSDCAFHSNFIAPDQSICIYPEARSNLGGAIFSQGPVELEGCRFVENSVAANWDREDVCYSGALYASVITAESTEFYYNSATPCAYNSLAFSVARAPGSQSYLNCLFVGNYVAGERADRLNGGLISGDDTISLEGCVFASNNAYLADRTEGGSLLQAPTLTLLNSTFYDNATISPDATTPMELLYASTSLDIQNCIFYANADHVSTSSPTASISCTDCYNNTLGDWTGSIAAFAGINGNLNQDPGFCNAPVLDFGLQATSVCLAANNSCQSLIGALPQGCDFSSSIVFSAPFPSSPSGIPMVTGDEGVAITVSSTTVDEVDASSLCMRVDYDGDGFDSDPREQWMALNGYANGMSIRIEEALSHIAEVSENNIEVEFGARTTTETNLSYESTLLHVDRIVPDAVQLFLASNYGSSVDLHFTTSAASDFAAYRIWISHDSTIDAGDRIWSTEDDPALASAATTESLVTELVNGLGYWFAIEVLDEAGNASALSNIVSRTGLIGNVLRVPTDYTTLSAALSASAEDDIILLAAGTHYSWNNVLTHSVSIFGESADSAAVVVDAENHGRHFSVNNSSVDLHLANLCLINGRTTAPWGSSPMGGSIYFNGGNLSATNCDWIHNRTVGEVVWGGEYGDESFCQNALGGALFIQSATSAELNECRFYNSTCYAYNTIARGGAIYSNASLDLSSCSFNESLVRAGGGEFDLGDSSGEGAAVYCASAVDLYACQFESNSIDLGYHSINPLYRGAGLFAQGDVTVESCAFTGNGIVNAGSGYYYGQAANGMAIYTSQLLHVQYSQFVGNHSFFGVEGGNISAATGYVLRGGLVELDHCTIHGNAFEGNRVAPSAVSAETGCQIANCILSANTGMDSPVSSSGSMSVSCTDIYGNFSDWTGDLAPFASINGNLSVDPLYVNAPDDLHLQTSSPCLPTNNSCGVLMGALGASGTCQVIPAITDLVALWTETGVQLSWSNPAPALVSEFQVHLGATQDFVPDASNLVAIVSGTQYTYSPGSPDCIGFLRVIAVSAR